MQAGGAAPGGQDGVEPHHLSLAPPLPLALTHTISLSPSWRCGGPFARWSLSLTQTLSSLFQAGSAAPGGQDGVGPPPRLRNRRSPPRSLGPPPLFSSYTYVYAYISIYLSLYIYIYINVYIIHCIYVVYIYICVCVCTRCKI